MLIKLFFVPIVLLSCGSNGGGKAVQEQLPNETPETSGLDLIEDQNIKTTATKIPCHGQELNLPQAEDVRSDVYLFRIGLRNPHLAKSQSAQSVFTECILPALKPLMVKEL